ncbi:hypothetical protein FQR65_LT16039 [Abscondita terminalis]|nr:hypothetical protein FQR65_LT16039 [Abscondita terminalis]
MTNQRRYETEIITDIRTFRKDQPGQPFCIAGPLLTALEEIFIPEKTEEPGSSLLQDVDKMVAMTKAVVELSPSVTVQTRLGWDDNPRMYTKSLNRLQDVGIKSSFYSRAYTRAQDVAKGQARPGLLIKRCLKRNPRIKSRSFGNGDIDS